MTPIHTACCAGCSRSVAGSGDLGVDEAAALVAWEKDERGRWWCTECQTTWLHRMPLVEWRVQRWLRRRDNDRRLYAKAERWARMDTVLWYGLLGVLTGIAVALVVVAIF